MKASVPKRFSCPGAPITFRLLRLSALGVAVSRPPSEPTAPADRAFSSDRSLSATCHSSHSALVLAAFQPPSEPTAPVSRAFSSCSDPVRRCPWGWPDAWTSKHWASCTGITRTDWARGLVDLWARDDGAFLAGLPPIHSRAMDLPKRPDQLDGLKPPLQPNLQCTSPTATAESVELIGGNLLEGCFERGEEQHKGSSPIEFRTAHQLKPFTS